MQSAERCLNANDNCKKGNNRILNEYYCLYLPVFMIVHKKCEKTSRSDEKNIIFFVISFDKIISLEG